MAVQALITAQITNLSESDQKYDGRIRIDKLNDVTALPGIVAPPLVTIPAKSTKLVSTSVTMNYPGTYKISWEGASAQMVVNPQDTNAPLGPPAGGWGTASDFKGVDVRGKVVVLFFGYTQCPDVCPTTMTELVEVKRRLGADGDRLQVLFVTVDPVRDTPAMLKAYLANFDPSFLALIPASPQELAEVAKAFRIYYKKVEGRSPTSYTMDHSAGSYIYDTHGKLRLYSRYGARVEDLAEDVRLLLRQPG